MNMKIRRLAKILGVDLQSGLVGIKAYMQLRSKYISKFHKIDRQKFQSPSIDPSTHTQRNVNQNVKEFSVYQRADFTPVLLETSFNNIFKEIGGGKPRTLFFNSGMSVIATLMFYLKNTKKTKSLLMGENVYFETKWLAKNYPNVYFFNEYNNFTIPKKIETFWIEYPINCTQPSKYPFDQDLDIKKVLKMIIKHATLNKNKTISLVIDYTLYYLSNDLIGSITKLPNNLNIYLVTSLQKHRGYGLDLTNGGAVTIYGNNIDYDELEKLRTITGANITQETVWTMPIIKSGLINKIILDSSNNANKIFNEISKHRFNGINFYYSDNKNFKTSFIFIKIDKSILELSIKFPFFSDLLIGKIIKSAEKNNAIMSTATSFGLPFTRIFKNSERYDNTNSLRIAVGYDEDMCRNVSKAIIEGTYEFLRSISPLVSK